MSQFFDYTGVVDEVHETQSFGSNGFTKREVIIGNDVDSPSKYPNPVKFTFKKDNCSLLDGIRAVDPSILALDLFMQGPTARVKDFAVSKIKLLGADR